MHEEWKEIAAAAGLPGAELGRVSADARGGSLRVLLHINRLPDSETLEKAQNAFRKRFAGCKVHVRLACPALADAFMKAPAEYAEALTERLVKDMPGAAPFLRAAKWEMDGGTLKLTTRGEAGASYLSERGGDVELAKIIKTLFLQDIPVRVLSEEYIADAVAEAERMEREREYTRKVSENIEKARQKEKLMERILAGSKISGENTHIGELHEESGSVVVEGRVIKTETRVLKGDKRILVSFGLHDNTGSILCKAFWDNNEEFNGKAKLLNPGTGLRLRGECRYDKFSNQVCLNIEAAMLVPMETRKDTEEETRVELHLHTQMSAYDGVTSAKAMIEQAAQWGHPAVAITDHGVLQAYPEAFDTVGSIRKKNPDFKLIPGMEAYVVNDREALVYAPDDRKLAGLAIVVLDVETTGFSPYTDGLTEIAAVRIRDGVMIDEFNTFVNPGKPIPEKVVELTNITDDMVKDAPKPAEAMKQLIEFIGEDALAAHNAEFDMAFLRVNARRASLDFPKTCIDTLALSRALLPHMRSHKLGNVCKELGVPLTGAHRAINDTRATAKMLAALLEMAAERGGATLNDLNTQYGLAVAAKLRPKHATLLAATQQGFFNLYKLTSISHMEHNRFQPTIPLSVLEKHREGLLIGSACFDGLLLQAALGGEPDERLAKIASFYDFLEIQPIENIGWLALEGAQVTEDHLREANRAIVRIGQSLGIPVCATGDAHYLNPEDSIFREILMHNKHFPDERKPAPLYLRTTREMLDAFAYLGEETARAVVIDAPRAIAGRVEVLSMFPKHPRNEETFQPTLPDAEEKVKTGVMERAQALYGDPLPDIVQKRVEKELRSIIGNGFATLYLSAQILVQKSLSDGYLVGSRGSVGSSFAATMLEITEVNPLPPHYLCPECKLSDFEVDVHDYPCGVDLPERACPNCGAMMNRDGYDIPFEVFLGFDGDKVPDIDLNFSGEYQPIAHAFVETMFGKGKVFRAGTIGTLAERKAFGEVMRYLEETGRSVSDLEKERLALGITGVKVTTGQHPGGMVIVPEEYDIHHFSPIQHPADNKENGVTTHFDFGSLHDILVKLDILGHDDPTMIFMLQRLTGVDPLKIPLNDPKVMSLFTSTDALGVTPAQIGSKTGTLGIPEFGTKFVRGMLEETKPTTMGELLRISGLSHGTNVWLNNAQDMIRSGIATLRTCFCTRDDIMNTLIDYDMDSKLAFSIMENVRKTGKTLTPDMEKAMIEAGVARHHIDSCKKIEYMFPRAHAAAYVMMALRVAYFKINYPLEYYAAYFTVRADEFDAAMMLAEPDGLRAKIEELSDETDNSKKKDERLITLLEIVLEMRERGFGFHPVDVFKSSATEFLIVDGKIRPPLNRLPGLGLSVAESIVIAREDAPFLSIEDMQKRAKVSRSVLDLLREQGCLEHLPETSQTTLF